MRAIAFLIGWPLALLSASAGSASAQETDKDLFERKVRPVLVAHCYSCHSKDIEKPKGDFRLDRLPTNFADGATREAWQNVFKRVKAGEMPPKSKPRPSEK